jgi:sec-independent protein translocase protein TatA
MEALSIPHLLIILVIVLVFFGGRRIPEVMKGLGQGIHEFKEGMRGDANGQPTQTAPPASTTTTAPPASAPTDPKV